MTVSFNPATYTVTEGKDSVVELVLVRSGDSSRTVVITLTTGAGTAMGMQLPFTQYCIPTYVLHFILLD